MKFACALLLLQLTALAAEQPARLEFNRDIRPILSENCFYCHGHDPKHREADLQLDHRAGATRDLGGYAAIVPGKPEASEMISRLTTKEKDDVMPPLKSHRKVTPDQVALLKRWISEGATYQEHWAYIPPVKAPLPNIRQGNWPRTDLDHFVLARLEREGLAPSAEAAPATWLRRVSMDLTGLPPSPQQIDAFSAEVSKNGEAAYSAAVDRLLASEHFGERVALDWLDAARYADTHGFNNDSGRTMWRWRDWVIEAFNSNLPYDQFLTLQLAGDLMPNPTLEQRLATGFLRNHVINSEGGIIDEEYRVEYVADRVRTMSTAWLGLTLECSRCHDHKFDPISQQDYYRFFAFFNNVAEHGEDGRISNAVPMLATPTKAEQKAQATMEAELVALNAEITKQPWAWQDSYKEVLTGMAVRGSATKVKRVSLLESKSSTPEWWDTGATRIDPSQPAPKFPGTKLPFKAKDGASLALWLKPDADNPADVALLSSINYQGSPADAEYGRGHELRLIGGELEMRISARYPVYAAIVRTQGAQIKNLAWQHVTVSIPSSPRAKGLRIFVDGKELPTLIRYDGASYQSGPRQFLVGADNATGSARWRGELAEVNFYPKALSRAEVNNIFNSEALPLALAQIAKDTASDQQKSWLRESILAEAPGSKELFERRDALQEKYLEQRRALPTTMIMEEMPTPRPCYVLDRGRYDAPGKQVSPGALETLLAQWPEGAPRNRLGLARWFTQPKNPLTARVVVNRFWAQLFGTGLVKTLEDFGSQAEWPSHPEVLDGLARGFVDGGWNVKALYKTIVLSATYRQNSAVTPALAARDPENRLLARGPRVRLPAELIRDQALSISGLLTPTIGGPSVYPYQPDKLYDSVVVDGKYPGTFWTQSSGADLYRRSLYTFWKRTVTHPSMLTFDAPDREFCTVRRSRTNTPLQALILWNEPGYLEAARHLAARMLKEGGATDAARVEVGFRLATGRKPRADETALLVGALERLRADFTAHPEDASALIKIGESPVDKTIAAPELAAAASVANMILNLDETITNN